MDKEIKCIVRLLAVLSVFATLINVINKANAASDSDNITVGEELGLTLSDFQFDDDNDEIESEEPIAVDYDPISYIHATTCMCEAGFDKCNSCDDYDSEFLNLIYRVVEAEAGNQGLKGKQLVADVILNRIDSPEFPDNLYDVVYYENAFSVVSDGRINTVTVSEETIEAVQLELVSRLDYDITYFSAGSYNKYCKPAYIWRDHYFGY